MEFLVSFIRFNTDLEGVALETAPQVGYLRLLSTSQAYDMGRFDSEDGRGPSQRQLRVAELLRRELAEYLGRGEVHDPDLDGVSITVGEVRTTPDLRQAWVYVLPLGGQDADVIVQALERNRKEIRHNVTKNIKLKYSPDLKFVVDTSFDQMDATRRMFEDERVRRDVEHDQEDASDT